MAIYLSSGSTKRTKSLGLKPLGALLVLGALIVGSLGAIFTAISSSTIAQNASAVDPVNIVVCELFPEDGMVRAAYQSSQTDDFYFDTQSKSAVSSGKQDVNIGLNWILGISGMDFNKVNADIIGQEVEKAGTSLRETAEMTEEELKENWNKGPAVNPYDRFGMAGTTFTSYNGEWKYYLVDACEDGDPVDLKEGVFYDDRLETTSTWEDRADSKDPRTIQHVKSETSRFWFGFVTLVSNMIFWVTKLITTLTIAFINFSFVDMTKVMGLDGLLVGKTGSDGIFGQLFNGVYSSLILLAMAFTGIKLFIDAAVHRKYRQALGSTLISIGLFVLAVIVSIKPALFVNLPNTAAVTIQTVIVKAFTGGLEGGDGLCATDSGTPSYNYQEGAGGKKDQAFLTQVSQNMRSAIGCTFWQTFVFQPWAEGQWGMSWNETWAVDEIPSWAPSGAKALKNSNGEMVGDAAVPLGDGKVLHNWAVFNLSTLTNAHSPVGHEGSFSKYSQGVANDWWRIVDALTNYEVEEVSTSATVGQEGGSTTTEQIDYTTSKGNSVLGPWDTWSGNNPGTRFASAVSSLFIGAVGLIAPFFLGLMSAVFSLGMTIVMVFLPIMLLLGSFGGFGFNIFKQWVLLLWSLFTKRISTGIMLMLSIVFINAAIVLMRDVGWWQGSLMLVLLTVIIIKSRHRMIDMFAASGGGSFASVASRIGSGLSTTGKAVGGIALSTASGAMYSKLRGGTLMTGAGVGMKNEFNSLSYQMPFLREVRTAQVAAAANRQEPIHAADGSLIRNCAMCQEKLQDGDIVKMGLDGLWYCRFCSEGDVQIEGGVEMIYRDAHELIENKAEALPTVAVNSTADQQRGTGKIGRLFSHRTEKGKHSYTVQDVESILMEDLSKTIGEVRDGKISADSLLGSNIPVEIQGYLDSGMLESLVEADDWEAVASAYASAYSLAIQNYVEEKLDEQIERAASAAEDEVPEALIGEIESPREELKDLLRTRLGEIQVDPRTTNDLELRASAMEVKDKS